MKTLNTSLWYWFIKTDISHWSLTLRPAVTSSDVAYLTSLTLTSLATRPWILDRSKFFSGFLYSNWRLGNLEQRKARGYCTGSSKVKYFLKRLETPYRYITCFKYVVMRSNGLWIIWSTCSGRSSSRVTGAPWATAQLQASLILSKWSVITKQPYTWTHVVNGNVHVGLLRDDTPLWKYKAGLKLCGCSPGTGHSLELFPYYFPTIQNEDPKYLFPRGNQPLLYHQIGNINFFIFITNQ